jgi:hypothetical protein
MEQLQGALHSHGHKVHSILCQRHCVACRPLKKSFCHKGWFLPRVREAQSFGIIAELVCVPGSSLPHGKKDPVLLLHDLAARLLPSPLQVETLTLEEQGLTLDVKVTTPTAPCPTQTPPRHPLRQCIIKLTGCS